MLLTDSGLQGGRNLLNYEGFTGSMASCCGVPWGDYVQMGRGEGRKKSPVARAPHERIAGPLSVGRPSSGACPSVRAADAAARDRFVLERTSHTCGTPRAGACCEERCPNRLALASRHWPEQFTALLSNTARALSRTFIHQRTWVLPCVRATRLSLRLACRSLG